MNPKDPRDIAFIGHYTQDTIVSPSGTRVVDGGAFNYGAQVAARMGLKVIACTKLAENDLPVLEELKGLGVEVLTYPTPASTCLRLDYHTADPDQRILSITSRAEPFTPGEVRSLEADIFVIGASLRGEVSLQVIEELAGKAGKIALDVQGFVRVTQAGTLVYQAWPEQKEVLAQVDILKADAVEAEMLTGLSGLREAARVLAGSGPAEVVLTHRDGLLVYADGRFCQQRFYPQRLTGRSGRGDTCIAAYAARRLSAAPALAARWAAAVVSLKLEAEGPFRRDIAEVEKLIQAKYTQE